MPSQTKRQKQKRKDADSRDHPAAPESAGQSVSSIPPVPRPDKHVHPCDATAASRPSPPSSGPGKPSYSSSTKHGGPTRGPGRICRCCRRIAQGVRRGKGRFFKHFLNVVALLLFVFAAAILASKVITRADKRKIAAPSGNENNLDRDFDSSSDESTASSTVRSVTNHRILLWLEPDPERRIEGRLLPATGEIALRECFLQDLDSLPQNPSEVLLRGCSVTKDRSLLNRSDAVVFDASTIQHTLPPMLRDQEQVWVFFTPPGSVPTNIGAMSTFSFNWTMARRTDADVVLPFGNWTQDEEVPSRDYAWERSRDAKSAIFFASECDGDASNYVLEEVLRVLNGTSLRRCGLRRCGSLRMCLTEYAKDYYFLFVPESSGCFEHPLEAIYDAFAYGLVPVYFGKKDLDGLPANSYVYANSLTPSKNVTEHLRALMDDLQLYGNLFKWKETHALSCRDDLCYLCDSLRANLAKPGTNVMWWWRKTNLCRLGRRQPAGIQPPTVTRSEKDPTFLAI